MNKDKFEQLADILHTEGLVGLNKHYQSKKNMLEIIIWSLFTLFAISCINGMSYRVAYNETKRNEIYLKAENDCLKKEIVKAQNYINSIQPKSYKY